MKMTMKEHFTMFATISATIEATTNLSVEEATDMASVIVNEVTEALGIEVEPTEEEVKKQIQETLETIITSFRSDSAAVAECRNFSISSLTDESFSIYVSEDGTYASG